MPALPDPTQRYLDLTPDSDYTLTRYIGSGKIGMVYLAESARTELKYACKIVREGGLKQGWERELEKVRKLQGVPHIAEYRNHGSSFDREQRPYYWVLFDYVDGPNLRDLLKDPSFVLTMPFVESVIRSLLRVLHACSVEGIFHGDLHSGNILIAKPDRRILNSKETVYVTDFGYGGSHNDKKPKDDFHELAAIVVDLHARLRRDELNPRDKCVHALLSGLATKRIRDAGRTPTLTAEKLSVEFADLCRRAERQSAAGGPEEDEDRQPADYLWAEALGTRKQEWKNLFVPDLLAARNIEEFGDLLAKTVTVLTGARGCGKTMSFRRLTKLMDVILDEAVPVRGAGTFVGFYLNCRDLTDAFPWVPNDLRPTDEQQVIHFFHVVWLAEICKTIAIVDSEESADYRWLEEWLIKLFGKRIGRSAAGEKVVAHVRSFVEAEKERCRLVPFGRSNEKWPLARIDLLDDFFGVMSEQLAWMRRLTIFLFLDDYTIPIVPKSIQLALNPIIFRRRSDIYFKVSTEAANSFVPTGPRKKPLELHHDFMLLDLASESLHQKEDERERLLDMVFRPRIRRHKLFAQAGFGLQDLLGKTPYSHNELAWQMRTATQPNEERQKVLYHGVKVFVGLWTSDIRTMVEMFNDMLRAANGTLSTANPMISKQIQDQCMRIQGGEMMTFTQSIRDYELWKQTSGKKDRAEKFGNHLKSIVEAFIGVSRYELLKGKLIGNQGNENPKQAFRIEIIDSFEVDPAVKGYLEGLVRYHIFLQDWRGKSQRGMLTPRLYLNRTFLPYGGLTLSSHDHIQLKNVELMLLLRKPTEFVHYWKLKRKGQAEKGKQSGGRGQQEFTI